MSARLNELREQTRATLLDVIAGAADLTLIRGLGNSGDELIWAGTRALLSERRFREIGLEELASARGEVGLLAGSGAFSRSYHEWAPWALAVAEQRFERVIVLPSSFETEVDSVSRALEGSSAVVFAREQTSYARIRELCDARLGLDGAFFFDFAPYAREGAGVLSAYRTDREADPRRQTPADNVDISVQATSLEDWLERISGAALVRTDRAHVMIAAALMGKEVEIAPSQTSKVRAIADYALSGFPISAIEISAGDGGPGEELPDEELVLVLDPDVELAPGATERLCSELRTRPEALAAGARLRAPDGSIVEGGGELREWGTRVEFREGGETEWLAHHAAVIRRSALQDVPVEPGMPRRFAARDWSYRAASRGDGSLVRVAEPLGRLRSEQRPLADRLSFHDRCLAMPALAALAAFRRRHGLIVVGELGRLFGALEPEAEPVVFALFEGAGPERFLAMWAGGELEPVLGGRTAELERELAAAHEELEAIQASRAWQAAGRYYRVRAAARRLRR